MSSLVGVELLQEYVSTVVLTGKVKGHVPVSTMLIAQPERGKTSVALDKKCESAVPLTDVTGKGLQLVCAMSPKVTHIVVMDMAVVMSHSKKSAEYFFSMLLAMLEEGIRATATPSGISMIENGRRAIIGCVTSEQAKDNRRWWYSRGVARRMIPFHYEYPDNLVIEIKDRIDAGEASDWGKPKSFRIPDLHINVHIPEQISWDIRKLADNRAANLGQLGISLLKNYRTLAAAHAIHRGNWKNVRAAKEDVEFLERIDRYVSWSTPALL